MNINFIEGSDEERAIRKQQISKLLPQQSIIETLLEPSIESKLFGVLAKCVKAEIEIYRAYPKRTFTNLEEAKKELVDFDPRHPKTCFMGKAFKSNYNWTDSELTDYRRAVGTIPHPVWGDVTLLEIWGADHIKDYKKMVLQAFKYGAGIVNTCPIIKIKVNPLFQNKKSGEYKRTDEEIEEREYHELLLAKALFYGVNEPKKRKTC